MADSRYEVHFHHVGGYAGALPLTIPPALRGDVNLYLYDANAASMEEMGASDGFRRQLNIGQAVFDRDGEAEVHITYHPAASSLFPQSKDFLAYWKDAYTQSDMCDVLTPDQREVRRVGVGCTTLDAICRNRGIGADFLSLDAEGSERHILDGSRDALARSVVGLICEVHFIEVRSGQTTAGELFERTAAHGFHLADMQMHPGRGLIRLPVGWRAQTAVTSGDAFFFKRLDTISATYPAPAAGLAKLALFCLLTGRLEHAVAAALAAVEADPQLFSHAGDYAYLRLLEDMLALHRAHEPLLLPTWAHYYPTAESGLRHGDAGRGVDVRDTCRRYFSEVNPVAFIARAVGALSQEDSQLEALLRRYGLDGLAGTVKQHRLNSTVILLSWLGLVESGNPTTPASIAQRITERLS